MLLFFKVLIIVSLLFYTHNKHFNRSYIHICNICKMYYNLQKRTINIYFLIVAQHNPAIHTLLAIS